MGRGTVARIGQVQSDRRGVVFGHIGRAGTHVHGVGNGDDRRVDHCRGIQELTAAVSGERSAKVEIAGVVVVIPVLRRRHGNRSQQALQSRIVTTTGDNPHILAIDHGMRHARPVDHTPYRQIGESNGERRRAVDRTAHQSGQRRRTVFGDVGRGRRPAHDLRRRSSVARAGEISGYQVPTGGRRHPVRSGAAGIGVARIRGDRDVIVQARNQAWRTNQLKADGLCIRRRIERLTARHIDDPSTTTGINRVGDDDARRYVIDDEVKQFFATVGILPVGIVGLRHGHRHVNGRTDGNRIRRRNVGRHRGVGHRRHDDRIGGVELLRHRRQRAVVGRIGHRVTNCEAAVRVAVSRALHENIGRLREGQLVPPAVSRQRRAQFRGAQVQREGFAHQRVGADPHRIERFIGIAVLMDEPEIELRPGVFEDRGLSRQGRLGRRRHLDRHRLRGAGIAVTIVFGGHSAHGKTEGATEVVGGQDQVRRLHRCQ